MGRGSRGSPGMRVGGEPSPTYRALTPPRSPQIRKAHSADQNIYVLGGICAILFPAEVTPGFAVRDDVHSGPIDRRNPAFFVRVELDDTLRRQLVSLSFIILIIGPEGEDKPLSKFDMSRARSRIVPGQVNRNRLKSSRFWKSA